MKRAIRTHYDNLKVVRDAPIEVIRAAYRTLAAKHHPDRNPGDPESARIMRILNVSYEALNDPERRKQHDLWIRFQESSEPQSDQSADEREEAAPNEELPPPAPGECQLTDLSEVRQSRLLERTLGNSQTNLRIPLQATDHNYWIAAAGVLGVLFALGVSGERRWEGVEKAVWPSIALISTVLAAHSIDRIRALAKSPLKSFLILTPLYIISNRPLVGRHRIS